MQPNWLKHRIAVGTPDSVKNVQETKTPNFKLESPGISNDSFLSDADGNGSIAKVIGRT